MGSCPGGMKSGNPTNKRWRVQCATYLRYFDKVIGGKHRGKVPNHGHYKAPAAQKVPAGQLSFGDSDG